LLWIHISIAVTPEELLYTEAKETVAMDPHIYRCYDSAPIVIFTSRHLAVFSRYTDNVNLYIVENFGLVCMEYRGWRKIQQRVWHSVESLEARHPHRTRNVLSWLQNSRHIIRAMSVMSEQRTHAYPVYLVAIFMTSWQGGLYTYRSNYNVSGHWEGFLLDTTRNWKVKCV